MRETAYSLSLCCAMTSGGAWGFPGQCSRNGKILRDGKLYCKQHDPVRVAAKEKERQDKYDTECEARQKFHKRALACENAGKGIATDDLNPGMIAAMIAEKRRLENASK